MAHGCSIHRYHRPRPLTTEQHHVVPRAWQRIWQPEGEERVLWLPKTVELCPTGHRSLHHILVEIMKAWRDLPDDRTEAARLGEAEDQIKDLHGHTREFPVAMLAPRMWIARGGMIATLVNRGQLGYALRDPRQATLTP